VELTELTWTVGETVISVLQRSAGLDPGSGGRKGALLGDLATLTRKLSELVLLARGCVSNSHSALHLLTPMGQLANQIDLSAALATAPSEGGTADFDHQRTEILRSAKSVSLAIEGMANKARVHKAPSPLFEESPDGVDELLTEGDIAAAIGDTVATLSIETALVQAATTGLKAKGNSMGEVLLMTGAMEVAERLEGVVHTHCNMSSLSETRSTGSQISHSIEKVAAAHSSFVSALMEVDLSTSSQASLLLQDTVDFLNYSLEDFRKQRPWPEKEGTLSYLVQMTRTLSLVANQIATACKCSNGEALAISVVLSRSSVIELLSTVSALAWDCETAEDRERVMGCTEDAILCFVNLMEHLREQTVIWETTERETVKDGREEELKDKGRVKQKTGTEGSSDGVLEDLVYAVSISLELIIQTLSDYDESDAERSTDSWESLSTNLEGLASSSENEMTDHPDPMMRYTLVECAGRIVTACKDLVLCVRDIYSQCVAEETSSEEQQWEPFLWVSQLSLVLSGISNTASLHSEDLVTELRIADDCNSIVRLALWIFMAASVKVESGSELYHQLQSRLWSVGKTTNTLRSYLEETAIHIKKQKEAWLSMGLSVTAADTSPHDTSDLGCMGDSAQL
jgi:hypothetical protein